MASMRDIRAVAGAAIAAVVLGTAFAAPPENAQAASSQAAFSQAAFSQAATVWRPIAPALFGLTYNTLERRSTLPVGAGALRLWDVGARWDQVEKAPGACSTTPPSASCDWSVLDRVVANARAAGVRDLTYVLGSTPHWARTPATAGQEAIDLYGPGTSSHPANDAYYLNYLQAVATRYSGRITAFEVWNEANITIFYRGTPDKLAALTAKAKQRLRTIGSTARLISASTTVSNSGGFVNDRWYLKYVDALNKRGMPIDAYNVHLYPQTRAGVADGPNTRVAMIATVRSQLARYPSKAIWDTEVNYGDTRPGVPTWTFSGTTAAAFVARTYIDSLRYGIARAFWYSYEIDFLGIRMERNGTPTSAATAYVTVRNWLSGGQWGGCTNVSPLLVRCQIKRSNGVRGSLWFTTAKATHITLPRGSTAVCTLASSHCTASSPGAKIPVGIAPILVLGS